MRQNPFSLYDFLGYVFPGALTLVLIYFFAELPQLESISQIYKELGEFLKAKRTAGTFDLLEETVILTILAYVIGHIVAYLSSVTVEKFAIWAYGYPSEFLLGQLSVWHYWRIGKNRPDNPRNEFLPNNRKEALDLLWRILIAIFLFPISICSIILGKLLCMKSFFVKPLDRTLRETIQKNIEKLANSLEITIHDGDDFHRVIYHYEYEHQSSHVQKLDNYVALYGFLRAMTFIASCTTLWITIKYLWPNFSINAEIDWHLVIIFLLCILTTYTFFMAFMKFYRRFTLESFMCLVIDTSFKVMEMAPYSYTSFSPSQRETQNATYNNYISNMTTTNIPHNPASENTNQTPSQEH